MEEIRRLMAHGSDETTKRYLAAVRSKNLRKGEALALESGKDEGDAP